MPPIWRSGSAGSYKIRGREGEKHHRRASRIAMEFFPLGIPKVNDLAARESVRYSCPNSPTYTGIAEVDRPLAPTFGSYKDLGTLARRHDAGEGSGVRCFSRPQNYERLAATSGALSTRQRKP